MLWLENKSKIYTVADMYDTWEHNLSAQGTFLPSKTEINQDFWNLYDGNLKYDIDSYFVRRFKRFWFYDQDTSDEDNTALNVYYNFYENFRVLLTINAKKYNELYRIYVISDDDLSLFNDFNITEEKEGQTDTDSTYIYGSRTDSGASTKGTETDNTTNQKMAFNSVDFVNDSKTIFQGGQRQDTYSNTFGQQTDTDETSQFGSSTTVTSGRKDNAIKNINQFEKYWRNYSYLDSIFKDVSKELLLI